MRQKQIYLLDYHDERGNKVQDRCLASCRAEAYFWLCDQRPYFIHHPDRVLIRLFNWGAVATKRKIIRPKPGTQPVEYLATA